MKLQHLILNLGLLLLFAGNLFSQSNQAERLFIPLMDKESQSNVVVTVSDFGGIGKPCPPKYTNVLTNTNLFTLEQQKIINEVFVKYKNVTTNSGPPGTVLAGLYKTNFIVKAMNETAKVEKWIARYQYTNSNAQEEISIGGSLSAKFRTTSNSAEGYNVYFNRTGGGTTLLTFGEVKQDLTSGLLARFEDIHEQGITWDCRLADFSNSYLTEYRQYSNGMVLGKFFMWNLQNGNLMMEAEFKKPYDWNKNRIQMNSIRKP